MCVQTEEEARLVKRGNKTKENIFSLHEDKTTTHLKLKKKHKYF